MKIEQLCACEGDRFQVTITAKSSLDGSTETGPTMVCCGLHVVAARALANWLIERVPDWSYDFAITPLAPEPPAPRCKRCQQFLTGIRAEMRIDYCAKCDRRRAA